MTFTAQQLQQRKLGIGASEAAAVLGLSRYRSPLEVYLDKVKETSGGRKDNVAQARGKRLQTVILDMYEDEFGEVKRSIPQITSPVYPFMFATLDATRADDERPVEAKTARSAVEWGESGTDYIPQEYLIQITHQMIVAEKQFGDVAALLTLDDFRKYTIALDPELAEMVVEGLSNFWKRVENREPPEPTTGDECAILYRRSNAIECHATPEIATAYKELIEVRGAIKPLQAKEAALIDSIKLFLKDADTLIVNCETAATWKSAKGRTKFDEDKFKTEQPELYAKYLTNSVGFRRFLLKEDK